MNKRMNSMKKMKMSSLLILFILCLATSGFNEFPERPGSVLETRMTNQVAGTAPEICFGTARAFFFGTPPDMLFGTPLGVDSGTPWNIFLALTKKTLEVPEPWTAKQLMAPADLAAIITDPDVKKPVIICVGPGALIKGSLDMGPAKEKGNLEKLKQQLNKLPRDANVVIYCGCCPFEHCPNIRPAFVLLNEMKFSNAHLLNLEHNIKTDWVDKGYPQA